jgi:hypothetical protein
MQYATTGDDGRRRSPRHNLPRGPRARRDRAIRAALIVLALAAAVALVVAW